MRYVSSQDSTTALGVAAAEHPWCSATKADRLPSLRFQTTTLAPALARLDAIPWPMMPVAGGGAAGDCYEQNTPDAWRSAADCAVRQSAHAQWIEQQMGVRNSKALGC